MSDKSLQIPGNYSCIIAMFHLSRSLGFHLVQSYLPTILMVFISWVSFWMDVNSVPGRVTLGITTLLTVSHKSTSESYIISLVLKWRSSYIKIQFTLKTFKRTSRNHRISRQLTSGWVPAQVRERILNNILFSLDFS